MRLLVCLLTISCLAACSRASERQPDGPLQTPRLEPVAAGEAFPVSVPAAFDSLRGYLVVPENRAAPGRGTIRLPVAVVRAKEPKPELAPVLFLPGGPGVGSLSAAAYPGAYPWTADRDFVVLGQRGTQFAEPALMCPEVEAAYAERTIDEGAVIAAARRCADRLDAAGVDRAAYHSAAIAADIEDLRRALDVPRLSLYGLSYGTRVALTVARDFPDSVVSMVLDSPLPHQVRYDDESVDNLLAVLRAIGEACDRQADCRDAYPDVARRFFDTVADVRESPWQVAVPGAPEPVTVQASDLVRAVPLASRDDIAMAPLLMDAVARRDESLLLQRAGPPAEPSGLAWGMRLSVWCGESLPFSERAASGVPADGFAGLDGAVFSPELCAAWGVPARPAAERAATVSPVPTLIIAGEYDALTPPGWGRAALETLPNGRLLVVPGGVHTETTDWGGDGCAMAEAAAFFSDPFAYLDASAEPKCIVDAQRTGFVIESPAD